MLPFGCVKMFFGVCTRVLALLLQTASSTTVGAILQPALCLQLGDAALFDLSANKSMYPVYDKDSLLNSNPTFDYGEFRRLAALAASSSNVTLFGFTFRDPGVYVFYPVGLPSLKTVISVQSAGEACPTAGTINPLTAAALIQLGVKKGTDIVVSPSWPVVIAVLVSLALAASLTIVGLVFLQRSKWAGTYHRAASPFTSVTASVSVRARVVATAVCRCCCCCVVLRFVSTGVTRPSTRLSHVPRRSPSPPDCP